MTDIIPVDYQHGGSGGIGGRGGTGGCVIP